MPRVDQETEDAVMKFARAIRAFNALAGRPLAEVSPADFMTTARDLGSKPERFAKDAASRLTPLGDVVRAAQSLPMAYALEGKPVSEPGKETPSAPKNRTQDVYKNASNVSKPPPSGAANVKAAAEVAKPKAAKVSRRLR